MKRDPFAKFTTEQLEAELVRRKNAGQGWGYIIDVDSGDDEDEDAHPRFGIVKLSYWKKEGCIADHDISREVNVPDGFHEVMESTFEFRKGDLEAGQRILKAAGFKKLDAK